MKNASKKLWFKRRRYGWGWTPVSWQGYASLALFTAVVVIAAFQLPKGGNATASQLGMFFGVTILAVMAMVILGITRGPAPRWRWGKKPGDNPDEDF